MGSMIWPGLAALFEIAEASLDLRRGQTLVDAGATQRSACGRRVSLSACTSPATHYGFVPLPQRGRSTGGTGEANILKINGHVAMPL